MRSACLMAVLMCCASACRAQSTATSPAPEEPLGTYLASPRGLTGSWVSTEPRGKRQFRMLPYDEGIEFSQGMHKQFPNGLYADAEATTPIWSVDFYEAGINWYGENSQSDPNPRLVISKNGRWLARVRHDPESANDKVLWFYEDGKQGRSYSLLDWVTPEQAQKFIDKEANQFRVEYRSENSRAVLELVFPWNGNEWEYIRFGFSDGSILERGTATAGPREPDYFRWIGLALVVAFFVGCAAVFLKIYKQLKLT